MHEDGPGFVDQRQIGGTTATVCATCVTIRLHLEQDRTVVEFDRISGGINDAGIHRKLGSESIAGL
jgi:hypothetical protein